MKNLMLLTLLLGAGSLSMPATAQSAWPARPIRMIVPFTPGGGVDFVSRITALRLSEALGQPVVLDHRPGASGTIGSAAVARAEPDGYTIGMATSSTHPAAVVLLRDVPYDPVSSFSAITQVGFTPYVLVGGIDLPARNLKELISMVRATPGKVAYATVGPGSLGYLLTRQFEAINGLNMLAVHYKGTAAVDLDLMNGSVALLLGNPSGSAPLVRDGRLRAFAVTRQSASLPGVPTFAEAGVSGFDATFWYGLVGPHSLPREIIERIQLALARQFENPAARKDLLARDVEPVASAPTAFGDVIARDRTWMTELARRINFRPEN